MQKIEEMHALVQALTKSEKREFRLGLSSRQKSQPEQLFDCLNQSPDYDEERIFSRLEKEKLLPQLPTHLLRLRKALLNSQFALVNDRSVDGRLRLLMAELDFLFQKQLLAQLPPRIRKAEKIARRFSRFTTLLQLIEWERKLILDNQPNQIASSFQSLREKETDVLSALTLQRAAAHLQIRMRSLIREILRPSTPSDLGRFEEIVKNPQLAEALSSPDFLTRAYARHTSGLYHLALQDYPSALEAYAGLMEAWKSEPDWIDEQTDLFLASYNNYQICFRYRYTNEALIPQSYTDHFSRHKFANPRNRMIFQQIFYSSELLLHLNSARFEEGQSLTAAIGAWLSTHIDDLPKSSWLTFQHNLAIFHFLAGNHSAANRQLQEILNFPDGDQRRDIRDFAQLLEILLHHEKGDQDLVEYRLRSLRRHFAEPQRKSVLASAVMEYCKYDPSLGPQDKLRNLASAFAAIKKSCFGLQELQLWLKSKQTGRPLPQIFKDAITEQ